MEKTEATTPQTQQAAAPAAAPSAEPASSRAPAGGATSGATDSAKAESAKDPWSPDSFGWDDWDGQSYDSFPEEVRPLAERFGKWHESRSTSIKEEHDRLQLLYDALLDGAEDPRIPELTSKYEQAEKLRTDFEQRSKAYETELASVIQWVTDRETERLTAEVNAFQEQNKWLFTPEYEGIALELLDAGWDPQALPKLVKLPKSVRESATQIFAKTKDADISLRVALSEAGPQRGETSGTASFVAGSTSPAPAARTAEKPNTAGLSDRDRFAAMARSAMQRLKKA